MAYNGLVSENPAFFFIEDYLTRIALAKIGVTFEVDLIEARYLSLVHGEFETIKAKELKKANKKR